MSCFKKYSKSRGNRSTYDKKAILIGLNYPGSHYALKGCINDVKNGAEYLKKEGYDSKSLFDNDISGNYNILEALEELGTSKSSKLFFHYSGHGTQRLDKDGDEEDGYDEVIYSKNGIQISDDQINATISLFPKEKNVVLVFDCCHSGSIVDLPYICTRIGGVKKEKVEKKIRAKVICISGASDPQTAADVVEKGVGFGALSFTLYGLLRKYKEQNRTVTWKELYTELLNEMSNKRYTQYPILSASDPSLFDKKIAL